MEQMTVEGLAILAALGFIGWLGGGRKWAFRTMVSAAVLVGLAFAGVLLYGYWADRTAERRTRRIHECAIAKVAKAQCTPSGDGKFEVCDKYSISDNSMPDEEGAAVADAENECAGEIDPKQKSIHEQISQYKREHGIKVQAPAIASASQSKGDVFDQVAAENPAKHKRLSTKACASKVRGVYPGAYDDLDDATLAKKVLAKFPTYCDIDFFPDLTGIR